MDSQGVFFGAKNFFKKLRKTRPLLRISRQNGPFTTSTGGGCGARWYDDTGIYIHGAGVPGACLYGLLPAGAGRRHRPGPGAGSLPGGLAGGGPVPGRLRKAVAGPHCSQQGKRPPAQRVGPQDEHPRRRGAGPGRRAARPGTRGPGPGRPGAGGPAAENFSPAGALQDPLPALPAGRVHPGGGRAPLPPPRKDPERPAVAGQKDAAGRDRTGTRTGKEDWGWNCLERMAA